jgi:hypothetical protein
LRDIKEAENTSIGFDSMLNIVNDSEMNYWHGKSKGYTFVMYELSENWLNLRDVSSSSKFGTWTHFKRLYCFPGLPETPLSIHLFPHYLLYLFVSFCSSLFLFSFIDVWIDWLGNSFR